MNNLLSPDYGAMESTKSIGSETLKQRLDYAVVNADKNLQDAKRAREILDKYPELEELINLMARMRY